MNSSEIKALYTVMFADYPDIVSAKQLQQMLGVSRHMVYDLLAEREIKGVRIGNAYKIPKINVIRYLLENSASQKEGA